MKSTTKLFVSVFCFELLSHFNAIAQQKFTEENALCYYIKIWNRESDINYLSSWYFEKYNPNYETIRNDEFKKQKAFEEAKNKITSGVQSVDFNKKFYRVININLQPYNFNQGSFPFDISNEWEVIFQSFHSWSIGLKFWNAINYNDFNYSLKVSQSAAEAFLDRRKAASGFVDRSVYIKVIFSLLNQRWGGGSQPWLRTYMYQIDIFEDRELTKKLGSIFPQSDYYDKINGVKVKDGQITTYYDKDWNVTNGSSGANFYRVINYADGRINGTVKDFFISGKLQMEGTYEGYRAEYRNGPCTWYYENGTKAAQTTYSNEKINGFYQSWYSNGNKKEEVVYKNGKKDGCDLEWDENGKKKWGSHYYILGETDYKKSAECRNLTSLPIENLTISSNSGDAKNDKFLGKWGGTEYFEFTKVNNNYIGKYVHYAFSPPNIDSVIFTPTFENNILIGHAVYDRLGTHNDVGNFYFYIYDNKPDDMISLQEKNINSGGIYYHRKK